MTTPLRHPHALVLVLGLAVAISTIPAAAQAPTWRTLSPAHSPSPRTDPTLALDQSTGRIVLFGGSDASGYLDDTWVWDGRDWTEVHSPVRPAARRSAALGWDPHTGGMVLFGGDVPGAFSTDTWLLTASGWQQLTPSQSPPYPLRAWIEADPVRGECFLFTVGVTGLETWEFDGSDWALVPANPAPPALLPVTRACYLPSGPGILVLFTFPFEQAWLWSNRRWNQVPWTPPPGQSAWMLATDRTRDKLVIGRIVHDPVNGSRPELFDARGGAWDPGVPATSSSPMHWDRHRGTLVGFGGLTGYDTGTIVVSGATTEFGRPRRPGLATPFGSGCPGAAPLNLAARNEPTIGSTLDLEVLAVPANAQLGALALGLSRSQLGALTLPYPLDALGMPGCTLLQSMDEPGIPLVALNPPQATASIPFPNRIELVGATGWFQATIVAPGINPAGAVASNGLEVTLGGLH